LTPADQNSVPKKIAIDVLPAFEDRWFIRTVRRTATVEWIQKAVSRGFSFAGLSVWGIATLLKQLGD